MYTSNTRSNSIKDTRTNTSNNNPLYCTINTKNNHNNNI